MYLTRLRLDAAHPQARRDLASAYEMHRTLTRAFAPSANDAPARFLWRLETQAPGALNSDGIVLVHSSEPGHWQVLDDLTGYLRATPDTKCIDLEHLLQPGRTCFFRLLCNPTVTRNGKRLGLMRDGDQHEWLKRQGAQHGFDIEGARIGRSERMSWRQGRGGRLITVQVVQFDGLLRVAEPGKLAAVVRSGLGHGKALGLGMLSLAPQRQGR